MTRMTMATKKTATRFTETSAVPMAIARVEYEVRTV